MIAPWKNERIKLIYERPEIRASVEIILSVFSVGFLLLFAIRPTLATVVSLQKKIEDQSLVDTKLTTKITQLVRAQSDLTTYAEKLTLFDLAVSDLHDQGPLAKRVEVLVRESGLTINSLSLGSVPLLGSFVNLSDAEREKAPPPTEPGGKMASFEIDFDLSGSADQVSEFLMDLENIDRVVILRNIDIKREDLRSVQTNILTKGVRVLGRATAYYVLATSP
jgi:Tfp pilus assembly protein PilO